MKTCLWLSLSFLVAMPLYAQQLVKNLNNLKRQLMVLQQALGEPGQGLEPSNERKLDADDVIDYVLEVLSPKGKDIFKKVLNGAQNTEALINEIDEKELEMLLYVMFEFDDAHKGMLKYVLQIVTLGEGDETAREEPIEEEIPVPIPTPLLAEPVQVVPPIRPLPPIPMQQEPPAPEQQYEPAPMPPPQPVGQKEVIAPTQQYQPAPPPPGGDIYGAPPPPPPMGGLRTYRPLQLTDEKKQDVENELERSMTGGNLAKWAKKALNKPKDEEAAKLANLVLKKVQARRGAFHVEEEEDDDDEEDQFIDLYNKAPTAIEEPQGKMLDWEALQKKAGQQNQQFEDGDDQLNDNDDEWD